MTSTREVKFAGHAFILDAELALWWPAQSTLVASDLHFEKASFLNQFGAPLAAHDTLDTLIRLKSLVARYRPQRLILLGDSFHDRKAWQRLSDTTRQSLLEVCGSVETCNWVEGNHDVALMGDTPFTFEDTVTLNGIDFRHEHKASERPQIIGHFHPKMTTHIRGHRITGRCFAVATNLLIMPAFGTFTGGLDMSNPVFYELSQGEVFTNYLAYGKTLTPHQIR